MIYYGSSLIPLLVLSSVSDSIRNNNDLTDNEHDNGNHDNDNNDTT